MKRFIVGALVVLLPAVATAQTNVPAKTCAFDTAAHQRMTDWPIAARAFHGDDTVSDPVLSQLIGTMLRERFHPPASIGALFFPNVLSPSKQPHETEGWVFGWLSLNVGLDGRISNIRWSVPTDDSATNAEILSALRNGADSVSAVPVSYAPPPGWKSDVRLLISSFTGKSSVPFARVRTPMLQAEKAAQPLKADTPKYPPNARAAGIPAKVLLEFIVDETGRAVPASIRLVSAPYQEFVESAIDAVVSETFHPAKVGSCPVKFRGEQAVLFSVGWPLVVRRP